MADRFTRLFVNWTTDDEASNMVQVLAWIFYFVKA